VVFLAAAAGAVGIARSSRDWPTVPGRIVRSEIRGNRAANGLPGFRALIRYAYVVDDEEYEGREVSGGEFPYRSASSANCRVAAYPVGELVTVRYSPNDPEIAVLNTEMSVDVLYLPVMASLLSLVAIAMLSWGGWQLFKTVAG
jgi:hypothetical protein